jgi:hypothetical protein
MLKLTLEPDSTGGQRKKNKIGDFILEKYM